MPRKILIAIKNDFTREVYSRVFRDEKFEVFETKRGKETIDLVLKEKPDMVLLDISLSGMDGFKVLKNLKDNPQTQEIPVVLFSEMGEESKRGQAIKLEAKDFIVGAFNPPFQVVLRIKMHLGEEKTYQIPIDIRNEKTRELARDLGYDPRLMCRKCGQNLSLFLIRDLSKGKSYFKVSFICPSHLAQIY